MASGISLSTKERTNFTRLCRLLIDGGTRAVRDVFDSIHPPTNLHTALNNPTVFNTLKGLRSKRIINPQQWQKLYPSTTGTVTSSGFDITLLIVLLRNICGLSPPSTGWDRLPAASDSSVEADLARIKYYRNNLVAHIADTSMSDADFETYWVEIKDCLVRLGGSVGSAYDEEIQRLKVGSLDAAEETNYIKLLQDWENSERELKMELKDAEDRLSEKIGKAQHGIEDKLQQTETRIVEKLNDMDLKLKEAVVCPDSDHKKSEDTSTIVYNVAISGRAQVAVGPNASVINVDGKTKQRDVKDKRLPRERSSLLKASTKRQTEFQHKLVASHMISSVRTDDIFTNLVLQHGRKSLGRRDLNESRREQLNWYSKVHGVPLERCEEIFTSRETQPHYILVVGKAGIGKSIFCEKITRDWACQRLFQHPQSSNPIPEFPFVYLLTFRQLSSLGNELFNLQDILNRSPLLDEKSTIDRDLFSYLVEHPEDLLVIIDGYDEFAYREQIVGDYEAQFPNDPKSKMPVAVMCSKLVKGKIMSGLTLLVTSRPSEADELGNIVFDKYVEIAGFSPAQVKEYIEKYFKNEDEMKSTVLDHIMANETLVSFAHIPILCRLMCWYMDWHVRNKSEADLPVTVTDLFTDVIEIFLQRHHTELKRQSNCGKETVNANSLLTFFRRSNTGSANSADITKSSSSRWKNTLEKLSVLAATLLLGKKLAFTMDDMRNTGLREDEIENLKASGLLHCGPGFRDTAFKVIHSFCFTHLTVQEFLTANWFYKEKRMPTKGMAAGMVVQFMAGLAARCNDVKFLNRIVKWIKTLKHLRRDQKQLLTTKCLYEFKDLSAARAIVTTRYSRYCDEGSVVFLDINDVDCAIISFLLDIFTSLNIDANTNCSFPSLKPQKAPDIHHLYIGMCLISPFGLQRICTSLMHESSTISQLILFDCGINDDCAQCISQLLLNSNITLLGMGVNQLTDQGFELVHNALVDKKCRLEKMFLPYNEIGDKSVELLSESLVSGSCRLIMLKLNNNQNITDNCRSLIKELVKKHRPDVELFV